jgi:aspartyl-tRNA synthetase
MSFIDLRDRYGITQLSFNELLDPERLAEARKLNREFVIQARGTVVERENKNPNMATGDIELRVHELVLLNASATPPFTIEDDTDGARNCA